MTELLGALGAIIAALFGAVIYFKSKKDTAEALNQNIEVKEKLNEVSKEIAKNEGLSQAEEEKRKQLEDEANKEKEKGLTGEDLANFFNNRK